MKIHLVKTIQGGFAPADEESEQAIAKYGAGEIVSCIVHRARNYRFFRKWWSMIGFAYGIWTHRFDGQGVMYHGMPVLPSKNRFRKDVTILAGFYEPTYRFDGSMRLEAQSISFESMSEETFEQLYDKSIDVIIQKVIPDARLSNEQLRQAVNEVAGYV